MIEEDNLAIVRLRVILVQYGMILLSLDSTLLRGVVPKIVLAMSQLVRFYPLLAYYLFISAETHASAHLIYQL